MSNVQAWFYLCFWLGFAVFSWIGVQWYLRWEAKEEYKEKQQRDCD